MELNIILILFVNLIFFILIIPNLEGIRCY